MTDKHTKWLLLPCFLVAMCAANTVLWRLWHTHHITTGRAAWKVELMRTILLVLFLIYCVWKKHYRDYVIAAISCASTDFAWLTRLLHLHL